MKYISLVVLIMLAIGCSISEEDGMQILGNEKFSKEKWELASQVERGAMVKSFLETYEIAQMTAQDIKNLLGDSTAYYEYDEFPAYLIGPESIDSIYGKGYVLAFPINRDTGMIRRYVIDPSIKSNK